MKLLNVFRRRPATYRGKQLSDLGSPVLSVPCTESPSKPTLVPAGTKLPVGFVLTIPVGSKWQRKPPKKEVVRIGRVWYMSMTLSECTDEGRKRLPRADGTSPTAVPYSSHGWTVRAHPLRGGRTLLADAQWFLDNFNWLSND